MKKYLTVGTNEIIEGLFRNVRDTDSSVSMKPNGGLWLTEYNENFGDYNHWVDFLIRHPYILFYKSNNRSPWLQPCSVVSLSDATNLFVLDDNDKFKFLLREYPYKDGKFSYVGLSHDYDGIFIDLGNFFNGNADYELLKKFSSFGVSSLVLFNLNCIDHYQSGKVLIDPFDFESGIDFPEKYKIEIDNVKKKVLKK